MALKDLVSKAQDLSGSAAELTGKFLDEFNEALPTMRALGFTIADLRASMGLVPEVGAKLVASIDTVDVKKIDELIEKQKDKKTLVALLKALQAAFNIKQQLASIPFKGVEIDMSLGLPPRINIGFLASAPPAAAIPAAAQRISAEAA